MRFFLLPLWIILIIFGIAFSSINAYRVPIHLFIYTPSIYLPILLLIVFCLGAIGAYFLVLGKLVRVTLLNRQINKSLRQCEQELGQLRRNAVSDQLEMLK